tara:strand:+ start:468 stop:1394 length:927 start_codon:yes stop_codon:yes gene_type:complete
MKLKKPKFWDYKKPNILAYLLLPIAFLIQSTSYFLRKLASKKFKIKTICVGNFYLGGTGKTSLCIKINNILNKKNLKSCLIKKFYKNQIDEKKILEKNGKLFISKNRIEAITQAENENYEFAILDDGLQDRSIDCDINIVCFNNINWIGNGMTIPSGPLRENIANLKNYNHIFINGNLENLENIKKQIFKINPQINIHLGKYEPMNLNEFKQNDKYIVFSGIGNHQTFVSMIRNNGLNVIQDIEFPDHYSYKKKDIENILREAESLNCKIITTQKDYYRLNPIYLKNIKFIKSELQIVNEEGFINSII